MLVSYIISVQSRPIYLVCLITSEVAYYYPTTTDIRGLTVVFVEDAVDDWVTAAGDEDEYLCSGIGVDECPLDVVPRSAIRCRIMLINNQREYLDVVDTDTKFIIKTETFQMLNHQSRAELVNPLTPTVAIWVGVTVGSSVPCFL